MMAFVIRRLLYAIPTLFGVCLIIFTLFNLVGGDPAYQMLGKHATETQILELRRELGLDKSKVEQ
ncbi:MAG TPA: ABC transporter permease, partial [Oligoflexia bacterium]|nr:ABC transporter permease [Oligoflexia bacterium]